MVPAVVSNSVLSEKKIGRCVKHQSPTIHNSYFNRLTSSAEGQNPYIGTFQDYLDGIIPSVFEHFDFGIRESFLPRVLIPYLSSERAHWGCPSTCPLQSSSTTWEAQGCIFGRTATVPTSDPHTHASSQFLAF